jgi:rubrerythrin
MAASARPIREPFTRTFLSITSSAAILALSGVVLPSDGPIARAYAITAAQPARTTIDNLQSAYTSATRLSEAARLFATRAEQDGYPKLSSLLRATARSREVHAGLFASAIKAGGAQPTLQDEPKALKIGTTAENIASLLGQAKAERDESLPRFTSQARTDRNTQAADALRYARQGLIEHARLLSEASENLDAMKTPKSAYFVHTPCGYLVEKLDIQRCPVCFGKREDFQSVE